MVREEKRALQLPKQQLLILAICRFAEPVAMTSVYPYIPEMIQSFNVPADKVARWAGLMSATFSLSQCATGIAWGRASDRFGRKPIILLALTCTMISSILFGFSKDLTWAFITRSFQGLSNGNVGIIRTAVAELVPQKELQPLAFSIMPLVWNVGSIFGPSFGGSLVHPAERYPGLFGKFKLLKEYPFALPNLLISILFLCGISAGFLFLHETLEDKKSRRDYGLLLGKLITAPCTRKKRHVRAFSTDESDPFLPGAASEMSSPVATSATKPAQKPSGWSEVFSRQSNINLVVYTFLAMHSVAYDQLLPIFMHYPVQSIRDPNVHLPLKFAGGFGIDSNRIGLLFTVYGIFGMLVQFFIFPSFARRFGVLNCLKACSLTFPLVYIATPFTALLPTDSSRQGVMLLLMLVKGFCGIFAFPCSTILLTNSAASLKILGTLNGVATSISAVGRAAGPALAGNTFTAGVDLGYVVVSWWTLAMVAVIGAVPIWSLVEMEGFSANQDGDDEDDEDDEEDELEEDEDNDAKTSAIPSAQAHSRHPSGSVVSEDPFVDDESLPDSGPLTRSTTRDSHTPARRHSLNLHRIASPIGLGPGVIPHGARRYSSDLGATRSGLGAGGTSYY
ncbi:Major facilitator superfamily multidrug transporter mfsB [Exophiala dermatitidis]